MSVSKRTWTTPSGEPREAWVVRYYDSDGKYRTRTFKTKREAEDWQAQMRVDQKKGIHRPDSTSITIREAGALWLEACEAEKLEPEAIAGYEQHLRVHVYPATAPKATPNGWDGQLGDLKLSRLNTPTCEVFKRVLLKAKARTPGGKITDKTISRRTAGHVLASFKTMLNDAQTCGLIAYNPALPVRIKEKKRDRAPMRIGDQIPDRADVLAIVNAATEEWRLLFKTAAFTGLRVSELRALAWPNVPPENSGIQVCNRADWKVEIGPCKSKSAYRTVQVGDDLVEDFRRWKESCPSSPAKLVFPGPDGKVLSRGRILRELHDIQLRIGMVKLGPDGNPRPKYSVHSLRHFYASIMIAEGTPPKRLQELLGHASLAMTMDLYGHLFPPTSDEVERINRAMAKVFAEAAD